MFYTHKNNREHYSFCGSIIVFVDRMMGRMMEIIP